MLNKTTLPKTAPSPVADRKTASPSTVPVSSSPVMKSEETSVLAKVRRLLETERYEEALTLARSRSEAPMRNALAVCLMRMGKADEAVRVYRGLVLDRTGLFLREQVPTTFKTNYALALMLSGHPVGGLNILGELANETHPSVQKLREAVQDWKTQLSVFQKLGLKLGLDPQHPVVLHSPPGELE